MAGTTSPTTLLSVATLNVGSIRLQRSARIGGHGSPAVARLHYVRPRTRRRLHPFPIWVLALEGKEAMQLIWGGHALVFGFSTLQWPGNWMNVPRRWLDAASGDIKLWAAMRKAGSRSKRRGNKSIVGAAFAWK